MTPNNLLHENLAISVDVGRYTVQQNADGYMRVLRDGLDWRECTGDKLILEMAHRVQELERALIYYRSADFITTEQQEVAERAMYPTLYEND